MKNKVIKVLELLIKHGELFGLELVELSEGALKRVSIYTVLYHMELDKLIISRVIEEDRFKRRKYKATDNGRKHLSDIESDQLESNGQLAF